LLKPPPPPIPNKIPEYATECNNKDIENEV